MRCVSCKKEVTYESWEGVVQPLPGVKINARGECCAECGEVLFDADEIRRQERAIADAIASRGLRSGSELRLLRKVAGLKATELAELLDVTPETISRWERGKVAIPRSAAYVVTELYEHPRKTRQKLQGMTG